MSHSMPSEHDALSNHSAAQDAAGPIQIGLRLRATDNAGRALVSNVSSVHLSSGMAFIDFGFVEQSALTEATRAARAGGESRQMADGRLECRIAMGLTDLAQLTRQLQQVLAAANQRAAMSADAHAHSSLPPDTSLQ